MHAIAPTYMVNKRIYSKLAIIVTRAVGL